MAKTDNSADTSVDGDAAIDPVVTVTAAAADPVVTAPAESTVATMDSMILTGHANASATVNGNSYESDSDGHMLVALDDVEGLMSFGFYPR